MLSGETDDGVYVMSTLAFLNYWSHLNGLGACSQNKEWAGDIHACFSWQA
jgi:hypothetical protein